MDHFACLPPDMLIHRDRLFAELYMLLAQKQPVANVAIRLGNLMNFIMELGVGTKMNGNREPGMLFFLINIF